MGWVVPATELGAGLHGFQEGRGVLTLSPSVSNLCTLSVDELKFSGKSWTAASLGCDLTSLGCA